MENTGTLWRGVVFRPFCYRLLFVFAFDDLWMFLFSFFCSRCALPIPALPLPLELWFHALSLSSFIHSVVLSSVSCPSTSLFRLSAVRFRFDFLLVTLDVCCVADLLGLPRIKFFFVHELISQKITAKLIVLFTSVFLYFLFFGYS